MTCIRLKKIILPFKILRYRLSRFFNVNPPLPMCISLYATYRCNSKCQTCNIWKQDIQNELEFDEIKKCLKSLGRAPIWFTITGGEALLREDICEVIEAICYFNKPLFINIATNALSVTILNGKVPKIAEICRRNGVQLTINVSIDGIYEGYDKVRGCKDGFAKVMRGYEALKVASANGRNFNLGTNTTISDYNVNDFYKIYDFVQTELKPNSFLVEMASVRKAFFLASEDFTPDQSKFIEILEFLNDKRLYAINRTARLIQFFRKKYYRYVHNRLIRQYYMPCYAGIASAEIISNGDVVSCCAKAYKIGNLRDEDCDFGKIWTSNEARAVRMKIKSEKCSCDLSNIFYTNSLINFK